MVLRAFGVGPAGSLLARGRFTAREPVIITDFAVQHTDTALGAVVSDAVRAALSQSQVISLVPPTAIAAALRRMERPVNTHLDLATAREMAQREGVKAVVDGQVTGVGTGYILTLRLVSADSGVELASFRETGDGPRGLIDAADQSARQLRAKIGESLRSVQASPPLAQATTASLEALRLFSEAQRANGIEEDPQAAVQYAQQAVAADSDFASAWRLLAATLSNANGSRAEADSAIERAYRLRDRLPEMERLETEAFYFFQGPHKDRARALSAYRALIERGDSTVAPVNAGEVLRSERAYAQAESMNLLSLHANPQAGITVGNAVELELDQGHIDSAAKMLRAWEQRSPNAHGARLHDIVVRYALGDQAGLQRELDSLQRSGDQTFRVWGLGSQAGLALLHGRLADADRLLREQSAIAPPTAARRLDDAIYPGDDRCVVPRAVA